MNAGQMMLCWTPDTDKVALVRWPDTCGASKAYLCSALACDFAVHEMTFEQRKTMVFIEAMHLIIRDGCAARAVHRALLGLEEYRDGLSADMPHD